MIPEVSYEKGKETDVMESPTPIQHYHHRLHMYAKTLNRHFRDFVILWGSTVYIEGIARSRFLGAASRKSAPKICLGQTKQQTYPTLLGIDFGGRDGLYASFILNHLQICF